jgi:hypothetical protein
MRGSACRAKFAVDLSTGARESRGSSDKPRAVCQPAKSGEIHPRCARLDDKYLIWLNELSSRATSRDLSHDAIRSLSTPAFQEIAALAGFLLTEKRAGQLNRGIGGNLHRMKIQIQVIK